MKFETNPKNRRKKVLLPYFLFPLISALLGYFFSGPLFIEPLYKATSVIYAPAFQPTEIQKREGVAFGGDAEIAGTLQILQSHTLIDSLTVHFKEEDVELSDLRKKMKARIKAEKTRYKGIEVSVWHTHPESAKRLNRLVLQTTDIIRERMLRKNRTNALDLSQKRVELAKINMESILMALDSTDTKTLKNRLENKRLRDYYEKESEALYRAQKAYNNLKEELSVSGPTSYIADDIHVTSKPHRPNRFLYSGAAALFTLALLLLYNGTIK